MNVRRLVLVSALNLGQLPIAMRPLLIAMVGAHHTGSFAIGGLAGGFAAAGMAVTSPWWARSLSRYGDRRVLVASGLVFLLSQLALAVCEGPVAFVALAAVCGLCTPPVGSSVRAILARSTAPDSLTRAYAVNSVALEAVYVAGPLWVAGWLTLVGPAAALLATGIAGTLGTGLGAALAPPGRREPSRRRRAFLSEPAVRTLGGTYLAYWICMGAMWVLVPAFARHSGDTGSAGLLVTVWSVGSIAGGVMFAARPSRRPLRTTYLALLGVLTVTSFALVLPADTVPMMVAIAVFGLALAPWGSVGDELVVATVGSDDSAELFGWLTTVGQVGGAVGSALAGPLGDHYGGGMAFLLVTAALGSGLTLAYARRHTLPAAVS
jgi:MFS family permease